MTVVFMSLCIDMARDTLEISPRIEEGRRPKRRRRRNASHFMQGFAHYRDLPFAYLSERPKLLKGLVSLTILACYIAYFVGCLVRHLRDATQ